MPLRRLFNRRRSALLFILLVLVSLVARNLWIRRQFSYVNTKAWREVAAYWRHPSGTDPQEKWWPIFWEIRESSKDDQVRTSAGQTAIVMLKNLKRYDQILSLIDSTGPLDPLVGRVLDEVRESYEGVGRSDGFAQFAREVSAAHPDPSVRRSSDLTLARFHLRRKSYLDARKVLSDLPPDTRDEASAELARGLLYEIDHLRPGQLAPSFAVTDIHGRTVTTEVIRGDKILLLFWSVSCGPSIRTFDWVSDSVPNVANGCKVVAISIDGNREVFKALLPDFQQNMTVVFDGNGFAGEMAKKFNILSVPTAFVIDEKGLIVGKAQGVSELRELLKTG